MQLQEKAVPVHVKKITNLHAEPVIQYDYRINRNKYIKKKKKESSYILPLLFKYMK